MLIFRVSPEDPLWPLLHNAVIMHDGSYHYVLDIDEEGEAGKTFLSIKFGTDKIYSPEEFVEVFGSEPTSNRVWMKTLLDDGIKRLKISGNVCI